MSNTAPARHPAVPPTPATPFGTWNEPAVVCAAGDYGVGKSKDATLFDPMGWTFALKGSVKGASQFMPPDMYTVVQKMVVPVSSFIDVVQYVEQMAAGQMEARTVRIDDLSVLVRSYIAQLDGRYSKSNAFGKWNELAATAIRFRDACKKLPNHTIIGAHLAQPKTTPDHGYEKGGPDCGGRQAMGAIVPVLDVLYRVEVDQTVWPWPAVYKCRNPDADWHTKDRHGVVLDSAPMNFREIFWAAGMRVPRYPQYEWMDTVADDVASEVLTAQAVGKLDVDAKKSILDRFNTHLLNHGIHDGVAYWAILDGFDRATLAKRPSVFERAMKFGSNAGSGTAAPGVGIIPLLPVK